MKLTFLGGADEIGASSTLVEIAGKRILVDCGIRMNARSGDTLPWLAKVDEAGGVDAIVLTHAHMDHSGAIPVAHQSYNTPIYMTPPTLSIVSVLLLDALKIMEMEMKQEGELPLYALPTVERAMAAVRAIPFLEPFPLFEDVTLTFYPAGHILGAASAVLESADGVLMMSGDICVADQLTVPGLMLPPVRPDALVIETTYGNRLHASRTQEEKRLVEQVREVCEGGGAVLIPAFAIGRAQEVILILSRAMEQGEMPRVPIFVDGMVRQICSIYASYPELLTPWMRHRVNQLGNPFFYKDGPALPVWDPKLREEYAKMRPAIIVSSSGMLSGGPSQFYARHLAQDPKSYIAITGYQDEESPGRKLQDLARAGGGELQLGDSMVKLACRVGTYGLSAHSDASQLISEIEALKPHELILVHGDDSAKVPLSEKLSSQPVFEKLHRAALGDEIEVKPRPRRTRISFSSREGEEGAVVPLNEENLLDLAKQLFSRDSTSRGYTIQEILLSWGYPARLITDAEVKRVAKLLSSKSSPFKRDSKRAFLYRLRVANQGVINKPLSAKVPANSQKEALDLIDSLLPPESGLYRKSVKLHNRSIVLSFHFPKVAERKYAEVLEKIRNESPWQIAVNPEPHQQALVDAAIELIPKHWGLLKMPSLHIKQEKVKVLVQEATWEEAAACSKAFEEKTGFTLEVELSLQKGTPIARPTASQGKGSAPASAAPMEINSAYGMIRSAFLETPHQPLKTSLKQAPGGSLIEVAFISPEVGERYRALLDALEERIGWKIQIKPQADQHRIKELAKSLAPKEWGLRKEPSFVQDARSVILRVASLPEPAALAEVCRRFSDETGYQLRVTRG